MKKTSLFFLQLFCHYDINKKVKVNVSICYWPLLETKYCSRWEPQLQLLLLSLCTWQGLPRNASCTTMQRKKPLVFLSSLILCTSFEIPTKQECNPGLPQFCWLVLDVSELHTVSVSTLSQGRHLQSLTKKTANSS